MKIKTEDLVGPALDWAIGTANGGLYQSASARDAFWIWPGEPVKYSKAPPAYSTDWAQGGPIIEREKITVTPLFFMEGGWRANHHNLRYDDMGEYINGSDGMQDGPTLLIAAMRCFVASKLGDEVEVPKELMT